MSDFYERFFTQSEPPEPPADLKRKVMRKIETVKRRTLIIRTFCFGAALSASLSVVAFGYFNLTSALSQSGFLDITSLIFSDFSVAIANFQDFAFSMLESFPVFSAALLLAAIIITIWSAAHLFEDISRIREHRFGTS